MIAAVWCVAGLGMGELHMRALSASVRRRSWLASLRLPPIALFLVTAALLGGLAPAVIGWAVGGILFGALRILRWSGP